MSIFFTFMIQPEISKPEILDEYLQKIAQKNMSALSSLYKETSVDVYSYALSVLKNVDDAEDVLQDTFLCIYKSAHLYKSQNKPLAWILTITRNLCLSKIRSKDKISYLSDEKNNKVADFSDLISSDDKIVINECLNNLADDERQIIILRVVSDLKYKDIADIMNIRPSTVASKYNRAVKKLKLSLTEGGVHFE